MVETPRTEPPAPLVVLGFDFVLGPTEQTYAVLEFQTAPNPIRLFLTHSQVNELAHKANLAAIRIEKF